MTRKKAFEFLPHTADIKFKAHGRNLEKAFENAAYALTDVMTNPKKVKASAEKRINVESEDEKALLYDFLEQFLILADSEGFVLHKIKSLKIGRRENGLKLTAEIIGDNKIESYEVDTHIKAVTYQEMSIKKSRTGYTLQVILDI